MRLMRFLAYAYERNVLRTVGPVYQFRHARLRDLLAEQEIITVTTTSSGTLLLRVLRKNREGISGKARG